MNSNQGYVMNVLNGASALTAAGYTQALSVYSQSIQPVKPKSFHKVHHITLKPLHITGE
jgi:hypothetical protein